MKMLRNGLSLIFLMIGYVFVSIAEKVGLDD